MTSPKVILKTPRLILRELVPDDLDALLAVLGDPISMRFYPAPFDREKTKQWIDRCRERYARDGFGLWAVTLGENGGGETGELIGDCGPMIQSVEGIDEIEIGYHIRRDVQGRGYATEAARACRDWAFDHRPVQRVISLIRPENTPSAAVARNNGMSIAKRIVWREFEHDVWSIAREDRRALRGT